jgi:hypothetical protein
MRESGIARKPQTVRWSYRPHRGNTVRDGNTGRMGESPLPLETQTVGGSCRPQGKQRPRWGYTDRGGNTDREKKETYTRLSWPVPFGNDQKAIFLLPLFVYGTF